jgi:hypothetical protein
MAQGCYRCAGGHGTEACDAGIPGRFPPDSVEVTALGRRPFGPMNTRPFGPDSAKHWKCLLTIGAMTDGSATVPDRLHSWGAGDETPAGNLRS